MIKVLALVAAASLGLFIDQYPLQTHVRPTAFGREVIDAIEVDDVGLVAFEYIFEPEIYRYTQVEPGIIYKTMLEDASGLLNFSRKFIFDNCPRIDVRLYVDFANSFGSICDDIGPVSHLSGRGLARIGDLKINHPILDVLGFVSTVSGRYQINSKISPDLRFADAGGFSSHVPSGKVSAPDEVSSDYSENRHDPLGERILNEDKLPEKTQEPPFWAYIVFLGFLIIFACSIGEIIWRLHEFNRD